MLAMLLMETSVLVLLLLLLLLLPVVLMLVVAVVLMMMIYATVAIVVVGSWGTSLTTVTLLTMGTGTLMVAVMVTTMLRLSLLNVYRLQNNAYLFRTPKKLTISCTLLSFLKLSHCALLLMLNVTGRKPF
jgi:hypothetical protein